MKAISHPFLLALLLTALPMKDFCHAEPLLSYEFLSGSTDPSTIVGGITASPVTDPKPDAPNMPNYIEVSPNGQYFWDASSLLPSFDGNPGAVSRKQYAEFTVAPSSGKTLTLESLELDYGGSTPKGESFIAGIMVVCSLDDYRDTLAEEEFTVDYSGDPKSWKPVGRMVIDLSQRKEFQTLKGPVTFRIFARAQYAGEKTLSKAGVRVSNIVLNGTANN